MKWVGVMVFLVLIGVGVVSYFSPDGAGYFPSGFGGEVRQIKSDAKDSRFSLLVTGDVMLGRTVMTTSLDKHKDPRYPFLRVNDGGLEADVLFVNLENPVTDNCPRHYDGFRFCADPQMVEGLIWSGVDIVNLANNHTHNYGNRGMEETIGFLSAAGLRHTGIGKVEVMDVKGVRVGFVGFDLVDRELSELDKLLVLDAKAQVDVLVVAVHWGQEYRDQPNEKQRKTATVLVEAGADVIVGHHPHWVQPIEWIGDVPVMWSLGNFVFDQMWSEKTRTGKVVRLTFENAQIESVGSRDVYMQNWSQPEWVGQWQNVTK